MVGFELSHEGDEALGDLRTGVDGGAQRHARLDDGVETILLLAETKVHFLRRIDVAILDRRHDVESVLRGEHEHRSDVVHQLKVEPLGIGADALSVDAEFERRRGLPAFAGEDARMTLKAAEDLR